MSRANLKQCANIAEAGNRTCRLQNELRMAPYATKDDMFSGMNFETNVLGVLR